MASSTLEADQLREFLGHQRWFAGKGREWEVLGTSRAGWLREPGGDGAAVEIVVVHVRYADGDVDSYQVPLVRYDIPQEQLSHALVGSTSDDTGTTWFYEALHDKDVTGLWMHGIAEGRTAGTLVFRRPSGGGEVPVDAPSLVIGAEQSNTSLVFDDLAMLKVFRRVSGGLNPDIEVHEALLAAGSEHIARPLGSLEGSWDGPDGSRVTGSLAMLQEFLRTASEGWDLAKASVRDLLAEGDLHADEVGGDFAGEAARLGGATAEIHRDLARSLGTATMAPPDVAAMAAAMRTRLERAAREVPALEPHVDSLVATFDALAGREEPLEVQRVHGDYHLGQVMRTLTGWTLLDFEGEPLKTLEERRRPDSPLRDVAGMLRSLDYAARHLVADQPAPHLDYRATEWADRNRDAFCTGYGNAMGSDPREDEILLRALETDKAVYEVVYESRNRPSWVRIPLSAIERLAAAK